MTRLRLRLRLRPAPRRTPSPACSPPASHATPPARRSWVPDHGRELVEIKIPHKSFFCGIEAHYEVGAWNAWAPEKMRLKNKNGLAYTNSGPYELGPALVQECRHLGYSASYSVEQDDGEYTLTMHLNVPARPGRWQARPLGRKLSAALGLDMPAGQA